MRTKKQWRYVRYLRIILWVSVLFLMLFLDVRCAGYIVTWQQEMEQVCQVQQGLQKQNAERLLRPLLEEVECFPVRRAKGQSVSWGFDDGYGEGRSYGGRRSHEGIDIMPVSDDRKQIPIRSVSDGVVEQLGWLELGGYRVGIRTKWGYGRSPDYISIMPTWRNMLRDCKKETGYRQEPCLVIWEIPDMGRKEREESSRYIFTLVFTMTKMEKNVR